MNIPAISLPFFGTIDLTRFQPIGAASKALFDDFDKRPGNKDQSNCAFIAAIPDVCSAWMAKLAIDADGRAVEAGYESGTQMDPADGQNQTSLKFADGTELDSEGCPFYVLPGGGFGAVVGLELGDVGVVIYRDQLAAVVLGDTGPKLKIGEGSIRLHNRLRPAAPDPCARRDSEGRCVLIRNASISGGVIFVGFPGSSIPDLAEETAQDQIEAKAFGLWEGIGGKLTCQPPA